MTKESRTIAASAARTATFNTDEVSGDSQEGLHIIIDVTVAPGSQTLTPTIQGYDYVSGKWYTLLAGAAINATGTTILKVAPFLAAVANLVAQDFIPSKWRINMAHSGVGSWTYSIGANILNK